MKKLIMILGAILLLSSGNSIYAQSEIKGFLGVEFGQYATHVIPFLRMSNPNLKWEYPKILIPEIKFLETFFNNGLSIEFKNDKLIKGEFSISRYSSTMLQDGFYNNPNAQVEAESKQNNMRKELEYYYDYLINIYSTKYGKPAVKNTSNTVWADINGNTITLSVEQNNKFEDIAGGMFVNFGSLLIIYRSKEANEDF